MAASIQLPPLVQQIILDPRRLQTGAKSVVASANKAAAATNAVNTGAMTATQSLTSLGFRAQTVGRIMSRRFAMPIVAAVGLGVASFGRFEKEMTKIEGLVGVSSNAVKQFSEEIMRLSSSTGRAPQELGEAMFFIASAGLRGADAMGVLEASAKGAAIGLGQTKVVADAATSAVNAYGSENLSGGAAVDILTAAVREGKVEADRLAPAIGKAIPVASAMGVEFHEVAAAISAMTRTGTDARTAAIQLRQIMQSILDPSRQTEKALRGFGIAQGELADQARERGLLSVLMRLRDLAEENEEAFADVFPNIRALAGALDITGANLTQNIGIFERLADATGDTDVAFQKVTDDVQFNMAKAFASLKVELIALGDSMAPLVGIVQGFIKIIAGTLKILSSGALGKGIMTFILAMTVAAGVMGKAATTAGIFAANMEILAIGSVKAAGGMATAAGAAVGFQKAMLLAKGLGILGGVAALGMLAVSFGTFSKKVDESINKAVDLSESLEDIRLVGERSIPSLVEYTNVLTGMAAAAKDLSAPSTIEFFTAFEDFIQTGFDESDAQGSANIGLALFANFQGRQLTDDLITEFNRIRISLQAKFPDGQMNRVFMDVFGTIDPNLILEQITTTDQELANFLGQKLLFQSSAQIIADQFGEDMQQALNRGLNAADKKVIVVDPDKIIQWENDEITDRDLFSSSTTLGEGGIIDIAKGTMEDMSNIFIATMVGNEEVQKVEQASSEVLGEMARAAIGGIFEGEELREIGVRINRDILKGDIGSLPDITRAFKEMIISNMTVNELESAGGAEEIGKSIDFMLSEALRTVDIAENDGATSLTDRFDAYLRGAFSIPAGEKLPENFKKISDAVGTEIQNIREELKNPEGGTLDEQLQTYLGLGGGRTQAEFVLDLAIERVEALGLGLNDITAELQGIITIAGAFDTLETKFGELNKQAKIFQDRFDLMFGADLNARGGIQDLQEDFEGLADSLAQSSGNIDRTTREGRENIQETADLFQSMSQVIGLQISEGLLSPEQGGAKLLELFEALEQVLINNGVAAEDAKALLTDITSGRNLEVAFAMIGTTEDDTEIKNEGLLSDLANMADDARAVMGFATGESMGRDFITGILMGARGKAGVLHDNLVGMLDTEVARLKRFLGIESPSVLFAEEIGEPITSGIAKGIMDNRSKLRNPIMEMVNDTISTAKGNIDTVSNAVLAQLDLRDAEFAREVALRDFGEGGVVTKREGLQRRQLDRRIKDAQRAIRLGQGNQEDLELTLLDAQNALDDFDKNVTSEGPAQRANIALMDAGFEAANALAQMKMAGDEAIELFTNLAGTVGIPMGAIETMLSTAESNTDVFRDIFDDDVIDAIERAADAWIIIAEGGSGKIKGKAPNIADIIYGDDSQSMAIIERALGVVGQGMSISDLQDQGYINKDNPFGGFAPGVSRQTWTGSRPAYSDNSVLFQELTIAMTDAIERGMAGIDIDVNMYDSQGNRRWKKEELKQFGPAVEAGYGFVW